MALERCALLGKPCTSRRPRRGQRPRRSAPLGWKLQLENLEKLQVT